MPLSIEEVEKIAVQPLLSDPTMTNEHSLMSHERSPLEEYRHLLDGLDAKPAPRLPQDFHEQHLHIGIPIGLTPYVIRGNQTMAPAEEIKAVDYGLAGNRVRFSKTGITRFLQGETIPGFTLLDSLETFLRRFVVMGEDLPTLLALWLMGTYCYTVFEYFPYLVLRSPEKRCGKSRTLDLISMLGFNAHQPTACPTEAQVFREPKEDGGVQIFDEMEGMTGDKERWGAVTSVLNAGFHKGQIVTRYKKAGQGQGQQKEIFETYVPRAIASISALETTLEDRSIMIMMQRALPNQKTDRFSLRKLDNDAQALRDDLHIFALTTAPTIADLYDGGEFPGLHGLDHRAVDLWEPILAIASIIDASGGNGEVTERMIKLASRLGGDRAARTSEDANSVIVEVLKECVENTQEAKIPTSDLAEKIRTRLGYETLTSKALSNRLHPLGLKPSQWRNTDDKKTRGYVFTKAQIKDLASRYIPELSEATGT